MACVGLSQVKRRKWKTSVFNETSAASAILKSALNITTTCDSYYQTTNKRKNNPIVLINMDKLKYALFDCGLHMYFRFQT